MSVSMLESASTLVRVSRSAQSAKALLGESFSGILITDRWSSYNWVDPARRQLCWSHLARDFKSFLDYGPEAKHLGERLLCQRRKLFRLDMRAAAVLEEALRR